MKNLNNPHVIPRKEDLPQHVSDLFQQTDEALRELGEVYERKHVAVDKPREGDVVYADGSDWDPGFGEGFYFYAAAQWFSMFSIGPRRITVFTTNGSYAKPNWLRHAIVICKGGGGGGDIAVLGTASGGGGGEGCLGVWLLQASSIAASVAVTIGAGGGVGAAGGATGFGSYIAYGGGAGLGTQAGAGGNLHSGGGFTILGSPGQGGAWGAAVNGGSGGGSGGGIGAILVAAPATAGAVNSGGGGGGGGTNGVGISAAAAGGSGRVLIFEF